MYLLDPHSPWASSLTQTLNCELNFIETLQLRLFSNIHTLLHLFATLSVTTAANERSFSTLHRLLAYLPALNMIRSQDRDPTGFCTSEPDPDWTGFWKKLTRIRYGYPNCINHCSKMLNQRVFDLFLWIHVHTFSWFWLIQ